MNITPQAPTLSIPTAVNPQTDTLRRENNIREVIAKPAAASQSPAEKGVSSDKERGRTPAQNNDNVDFDNIRKQAEQEAKTINGNSERQNDSSGEQSSGQKPPANELTDEAESESKQTAEKSPDGSPAPTSAEESAEQQVITELQQRDKEVRSHELAHAAVGGSSTGSPSYSFEVGPDGKKYAVAGEVSVDLSRVEGDPIATIAKMQKVHSAALAPAHPSAQDARVAASAAKIILQAQSELTAISLEDPGKVKEQNVFIKTNDVFSKGKNENLEDVDFDTLVNRTLESQEKIAPSRDVSVDERALRVESFYSVINQAYEKAPSFHFQLTA